MVTLTLDRVGVALGRRPVVRDVSAAFAAGTLTGIVGPNGAGKSTLARAMLALVPATGAVRIDSDDVAALPRAGLARRIAYLPQNAEIAWAVDGRTFIGLGRTPYVGAWGLTTEDRAAVARAMAVTGVESFADRVVSTLSGGERARVLLARALAGDPQWLLADEPLAGLDPGHVLDACDLFRRLADEEGRGVVLTLHDLDAALRVADRVIVLAEGRVLADAAPAEALSPAVLKAAYGVEARTLEGARGPVLEMVGRAR